ncbi:hypothetical protein VCO01S_34720 [Vibrio comitans NBRC 102076]|uniref:Uncharacterized protein n=2 Tax=Vibrio comitans TaxID=413401 RepID=A0A4Y3IRU7_9VIBR|nr:hypothetical protein VCO01S_34720 [Vibrio comitans NBRC 102076]
MVIFGISFPSWSNDIYQYTNPESGKIYELPKECANEQFSYAPNGNLICNETSYISISGNDTYSFFNTESGKTYELPKSCANEQFTYTENENLICDNKSYFPTSDFGPRDYSKAEKVEVADDSDDGWSYPLLSLTGAIVGVAADLAIETEEERAEMYKGKAITECIEWDYDGNCITTATTQY